MKTRTICLLLFMTVIVSQGCMSALITPYAIESRKDKEKERCGTFLVLPLVGGMMADAAIGYSITRDSDDKFATNLGRGTLMSVGIITVDFFTTYLINRIFFNEPPSKEDKKKPPENSSVSRFRIGIGSQ